MDEVEVLKLHLKSTKTGGIVYTLFKVSEFLRIESYAVEKLGNVIYDTSFECQAGIGQSFELMIGQYLLLLIFVRLR